MCWKGRNCYIIKYADDTIIVGLISDNDESEYREVIKYVSEWCDQNFLALNVSKTKEMIFDYRKKQNVKEPINIKGSDVDLCDSYKYLGVTLQNDLKWDKHISGQVKKANKRMYFVRSLKSVHIDSTIICMFYNSVVSSVLSYAITSWFKGCTDKQIKDVNKFKKRVVKMTSPESHHLIEDIHTRFENQCLSLLEKILSNTSHPLNMYYRSLPRCNKLSMVYCRTNRSQDTFVPSSIKLYNSSK